MKQIQYPSSDDVRRLSDFMLDKFGGEEMYGKRVRGISDALGVEPDKILVTFDDFWNLEPIHKHGRTSTKPQPYFTLFDFFGIEVIMTYDESQRGLYFRESDKEALESVIINDMADEDYDEFIAMVRYYWDKKEDITGFSGWK